tara:strand:+ start:12138 stop:12407 length:270 start_codon:yes stop_codon:yes gene_type:complete
MNSAVLELFATPKPSCVRRTLDPLGAVLLMVTVAVASSAWMVVVKLCRRRSAILPVAMGLYVKIATVLKRRNHVNQSVGLDTRVKMARV